MPVSNELAASLISSYLKVEHPVYGFFDAELVLRDLLSHDVQYCTSSLVNALLFWTSVSLRLKSVASALVKCHERLMRSSAHSDQSIQRQSLLRSVSSRKPRD